MSRCIQPGNYHGARRLRRVFLQSRYKATWVLLVSRYKAWWLSPYCYFINSTCGKRPLSQQSGDRGAGSIMVYKVIWEQCSQQKPWQAN